jgi:hypothetical protein
MSISGSDSIARSDRFFSECGDDDAPRYYLIKEKAKIFNGNNFYSRIINNDAA